MDDDVSRGLEALLQHARRDPDVAAVVQFGSSLGAAPARDVDIAVVLRRDAVPRKTEKFFEYFRLGDGPRSGGLDICLFQDLPMYIRQRVLEHGRVLLATDEDELYRIAVDFVGRWEDFKPHYEAYLEAVARG